MTAIAPAYVSYDKFTYAVDELMSNRHLSASPRHQSGQNDAVTVLLNAVSQTRWIALPDWLHRHLLFMVDMEKTKPPPTNLAVVFSELLREVAWYERQVWAINEQARFNGLRGTYPITPNPLFHTSRPGSLPPAFPLLPISQQYSAHALTEAIKAFDHLLQRQDNERHSDLAAVLARRGSAALPRWYDLREESWHKRRLSRNLWNAFSACLLRGAVPNVDHIFNEHEDLAFHAVGGAIDLGPASYAPPPTLAHSFAPLPVEDLVGGICERAHQQNHATQYALQLWQHGFDVMLQWCGGWNHLSSDDRSSLATELEAVWAQLPWWREGMPGPSRVFECILKTPLALCNLPNIPQNVASVTALAGPAQAEYHYQANPYDHPEAFVAHGLPWATHIPGQPMLPSSHSHPPFQFQVEAPPEDNKPLGGGYYSLASVKRKLGRDRAGVRAYSGEW